MPSLKRLITVPIAVHVINLFLNMICLSFSSSCKLCDKTQGGAIIDDSLFASSLRGSWKIFTYLMNLHERLCINTVYDWSGDTPRVA